MTTNIKQQKELNSTSNKWELVCEAYLILVMEDKEKDYHGRVVHKKSGESIRLEFKTSFETVNHGMTFESRKKSIREEKARHDIYENKVENH